MKRLLSSLDYRPYDNPFDNNNDLIKADITSGKIMPNTLRCLSKISNINMIPNNHMILEGLKQDYGEVNYLIMSDKAVINALIEKWNNL